MAMNIAAVYRRRFADLDAIVETLLEEIDITLQS